MAIDERALKEAFSLVKRDLAEIHSSVHKEFSHVQNEFHVFKEELAAVKRDLASLQKENGLFSGFQEEMRTALEQSFGVIRDDMKHITSGLQDISSLKEGFDTALSDMGEEIEKVKKHLISSLTSIEKQFEMLHRDLHASQVDTSSDVKKELQSLKKQISSVAEKTQEKKILVQQPRRKALVKETQPQEGKEGWCNKVVDFLAEDEED